MPEIDWAGPATPESLGVFASAVTQPATDVELTFQDTCHGLRVLVDVWPEDAAVNAAEALKLIVQGREATR